MTTARLQRDAGPPLEVRPMTDDDVPAAAATWTAASDDDRRRHHLPPGSDEPADEQRRRLERRIGHLLATDPGGSWVAVDGGVVVGLGQAFVREGYWVLSLLGVRPEHQSTGAGRAILARTLDHGPCRRGTIQASRDARAIRLYSGAGFDAHPVVAARGTLRPEAHHETPPTVRAGGMDDLGLVTAIDRAVRGAGRRQDVAHLLDVDGCSLLVDDPAADGGGAYAVITSDRLVMAAGRSEASATRVLQAALAGAPEGGRFEVGWLTAAQQWAIRTVLAAGLDLVPHGPVMTLGMSGPPTPAIPSGGYG
ncbi:MAG: GNAT family N-acetyltransferase [Acidimicrobiales bacterium]